MGAVDLDIVHRFHISICVWPWRMQSDQPDNLLTFVYRANFPLGVRDETTNTPKG